MKGNATQELTGSAGFSTHRKQWRLPIVRANNQFESIAAKYSDLFRFVPCVLLCLLCSVCFLLTVVFCDVIREGRGLARMLMKAFLKGITFRVGQSTTTGQTDTVTWNDIHHKLNTTGKTRVRTAALVLIVELLLNSQPGVMSASYVWQCGVVGIRPKLVIRVALFG